MRTLIEARLAEKVSVVDPRAELLEEVQGSVPRKLRDMLARPARPAAVLLGIVERTSGLNILFTERSADLKDHPGQVSFPGGCIEAKDPSAVVAALREAEEEIGLKPEQVNVIGCLGPYLTVTGFLITPVVGFVSNRFRAMPVPAEVSEVFEVPLDFFLEEKRLEVKYCTRPDFGTTFRIYEFSFEEHRIWGATAAILLRLIGLISNEKTT